MVKVRLALSAGAIVFVTSLTGCLPGSLQGLPTPSVTPAAETSTATPSPGPTPTVTPDSIVTAALIVDADSLAVVASDGSALADISYATPIAEAVDQLTGFLGTGPTVAETPQSGNCSSAYTSFDWEGFRLNSPSFGASEEQFSVAVVAESIPSGVSLEFGDGLGVGLSMVDLIASPSVQVNRTEIYFDVRGDVSGTSGDSDPYGGVVIVEADVVSAFYAPIHYFQDC